MENFKKMVLLIDADNTPCSKMGGVIQEVSALGHIVIKRAYGNWQKDSLSSWENVLKQYAVRAVQQFDYTKGKNATDIALIIDAMDLMSKGDYDAFVIVSSDSDFTPLAIYLREANRYVIGVGKKQTPIAFKSSCDDFIVLENIGKAPVGIVPPATAKEPEPREAAQKKETKKRVRKADRKEEEPKAEEPKDEETEDVAEIHQLLKLAFTTYSAESDMALLSSVGNYIKRIRPDFDVRTYGFTTLTQFLKAFPDLYEVKSVPREGAYPIVSYKCKK